MDARRAPRPDRGRPGRALTLLTLIAGFVAVIPIPATYYPDSAWAEINAAVPTPLYVVALVFFGVVVVTKLARWNP